MDKIRINMLSQATSVDGQGVGSAYIEQVALVKENDDIFEVEINSRKGLKPSLDLYNSCLYYSNLFQIIKNYMFLMIS